MLRRVAGLLTLQRDLSTSSLLPDLSPEGCALLHQSEAHLLLFQSLPHSLRVYPGWHQERLSILNCFTSLLVSHLESTLTDGHRVLPCFGRDCPPASCLESTLARTAFVTPLEATLTKNQGEREGVTVLTGPSLTPPQRALRSAKSRSAPTDMP
jgi:hypothetical protein